jgi:hypothetical protein
MSASAGRTGPVPGEGPSPRKTPHHTSTRSTPSADGIQPWVSEGGGGGGEAETGASGVALHAGMHTALNKRSATVAEAVVCTRPSTGTLATGRSDDMGVWPGDKSAGDLWPGDDSAESVDAGVAARKKYVDPEMMRLLQEWKLEGEVERLVARGVTSVEDLGCMTSEEVGLFGLPLRFRAMIRHINEEPLRSVTTASPRELEQEARSGQTMSRDIEGVTGGRALRWRQPWEQDEKAVSGEEEHGPRRAGLLREFDEAFAFRAHAVQGKPNKLRTATAARNVEHLDVHRHAPHTVHGYRAGVGLGRIAANDASCSSGAANAEGTPRVGTRAILPHTWGGDSGSSRGHSPVSIFPKELFNQESGQGLQLVGQATHDMQATQDMDNSSSPDTTHMQQHAAQIAETRTESSVHRPAAVREEADMLEKVLVLLLFAALVFALGVSVDVERLGGDWGLWGGMKKMANSSAFEIGLSHVAPLSGSTTAGESATLLKATLLKDAIKDELRQQASAAVAAEAAAAAAAAAAVAAARIEAALESARAGGAGACALVSAAPNFESKTRDLDAKAAPKGHGRSSLMAAVAKGVKYTVRCGMGLAALMLLDKAIFA